MNTPLRIAIADDERDMREYLPELLTRLGHEVVAVASTGAELVERCRVTRPDLVLTDVRMPDMDGIAAAEALNRERAVAVLLVSAHTEDEVLARAETAPVMGYLVKPVQEEALRAAIRMTLHRFRQLQASMREASDLRQALEERKVIERAKGVVMRRLRVDEDEAFRRLRKLSSERNRKLVEIARDVLGAEEVFHQLDAL
jgi:response regulator NasT